MGIRTSRATDNVVGIKDFVRSRLDEITSNALRDKAVSQINCEIIDLHKAIRMLSPLIDEYEMKCCEFQSIIEEEIYAVAFADGLASRRGLS